MLDDIYKELMDQIECLEEKRIRVCNEIEREQLGDRLTLVGKAISSLEDFEYYYGLLWGKKK